MKNKTEILKIAVQKSDRISQDFLELLKSCGLSINGTQKKLYCKLEELPIELYFFRGNDIPFERYKPGSVEQAMDILLDKK